jgi:hypothetical protein
MMESVPSFFLTSHFSLSLMSALYLNAPPPVANRMLGRVEVGDCEAAAAPETAAAVAAAGSAVDGGDAVVIVEGPDAAEGGKIKTGATLLLPLLLLSTVVPSSANAGAITGLKGGDELARARRNKEWLVIKLSAESIRRVSKFKK